jgi:hypothetical protein
MGIDLPEFLDALNRRRAELIGTELSELDRGSLETERELAHS